MRRPEQTVFIVENGVAYSFDAVVKVENQTSLKIAEQASDVQGKQNVVNYAVIQPQKVQMEVSVSDTVAGNDPLTEGNGVRSVIAYKKLIEIQERRNFLTVITPFYTFSKMMIESISLEISEDTQNEMRAQISFKQMLVVPKKESPKKDDKGDPNAIDESTMYVNAGEREIVPSQGTTTESSAGKGSKVAGVLGESINAIKEKINGAINGAK